MTLQEPGTVLITGGAAGLGLATVAELVHQRAVSRIVVVARDVQRARVAIAGLRQAGHDVVVLELDLARLDSVRQVPSRLAAIDVGSLAALVCNAGVQIVGPARFTADGFEETFAVNVLGHYLLARLLLPALVPDGRLVFVSSGTHDPRQHTGLPAPSYPGAEELAAGRGMTSTGDRDIGRQRYTTSKLCAVYLAQEFSRRQAPGPHPSNAPASLAMDPGMLPGTGLARDYRAYERFAWNRILPLISRIRQGSSQLSRAAKDLAALAADPLVTPLNGGYYVGTAPEPSSALSYDRSNAMDLWHVCAQLTGLDAEQ